MNVLLVVPWDNIGGVCSVVNHVAKHMRAQGHGVFLLLPGSSARPVAETSREGLPAFRLNIRPTSPGRGKLRGRIAFVVTLPYTIFVLASLLRRLKIDVVNVHFPDNSAIAFAFIRTLRMAKLASSLHGADLLPNGMRVPSPQVAIRALLATSDLIITPSDAYRDALRKAWPEIAGRPTETIPNGVDPVELGYDPGAGDTAVEPPYILSIVHLVHYKGVDVLIRAFSLLSADFPALRLKLVSGGPSQREFQALAASLGIADRVDFLGFLEREETTMQLRGATVFVLPSRSNSESFGIAAAEAMAVDRPVIVSRVGGLPSLVEHEVTGLIVPPGDAAALSTAMRRLLRDEELRKRLGRAAGRRVRRDFLWSRTGDLYEAMFHRLAGTPAPVRRAVVDAAAVEYAPVAEEKVIVEASQGRS